MDKKEITHILISVISISVAFTYYFYGGSITIGGVTTIFLTVGLGFILHEMGHKFTAIKMGGQAFYRMWVEGLVFMIFLVLTLRVVFAAPGATYIYKPNMTRRENGLISLAGPIINIILGFVFFFIAIAAGMSAPIRELGALGFQINIFLALFNLIPIPPLDGSKVFSWNILVWGLFFGLCAVLFFFPQVLVNLVL